MGRLHLTEDSLWDLPENSSHYIREDKNKVILYEFLVRETGL